MKNNKVKLLPCICGSPAVIRRNNSMNLCGYYYIECVDRCVNDYFSKSFSTREKECAIELWQASKTKYNQMVKEGKIKL